MPDRIERNVIIARSGVYQYRREELPSLNLPDAPYDKEVYSVYRPAIVLTKNKDKFTKLPLTKEHPPTMVGPDNFKELAIGWSGDTAEVVMMREAFYEGDQSFPTDIKETGEIGIQSTCQLLDQEALEYYDNGVRDVSPGYFAKFEWSEGKTVDGEEYDIIMSDIDEVNHLAFTQRGRGGQGVAMDSALSLADLVYYSNRITMDSNVEGVPKIATFRQMIDDIVEYRGEYEDDEIKIGVMELLKLCEGMPECENKAILTRIIKDFYNVKRAFSSDEAAKVAADLVAGRYESLDSKIMEDSMKLFGKAKDADPIPEKEAPPAAPAPDKPEAPAPLPKDDAPPVAAEAPAAPAAPGTAPVAATAMEVAQMPDDVSTVSDDELRALLNGLIKFAKSIAPGEAQEPQHQEAAPAAPAVPDSEVKPDEGEAMDNEGKSERQNELEEKKGSPMDSMYRMPMGKSVKQTKGIDEIMHNITKGRK